MSALKDLLAQHATLAKQIAELQQREHADAASKAQALIAEYGLTKNDIFGGARNGKKTKAAGKIVSAKYADPATGKQWSGRGITPKWITSSGKDKTYFLISQ